jgi:hypothetical protein
MRHKLSHKLLAQNSNCDCNSLLFLDTSDYIESIEPTSPIIQIYPPNWSEHYSISYNILGITNITPKHINHECLPSGVYNLVQSVCPNDKVKVSSCFLLTCKEMNRIAELACTFVDKCEEEHLTDLLDLKYSFEIAKDLVCGGKVKEGTILYNTSVKKLEKLEKSEECDVC